MAYRSRIRMTTIFHWPPTGVQIFTVFWEGEGKKGGQISYFSPQKALSWPERRIMTYCARGVSIDATCGPGEEGKMDRNFHASNWLFAQITHVDITPWNFACGVASGRL